VNFFLDDSCLGKPRSQSLTELITELNPDVQGTWYPNEVGRSCDSASTAAKGALVLTFI
jgi:amyloid beta precursor protein binding protein 1